MDEEAIEDPTPEVFGNKVVLREVFKYLSTSTLLSSCSLVNKIWREEARFVIWDHRECTVQVGLHISADMDRPINLWKQLCELDSVLGKMKVVPFNSLRVLVTRSNVDCDEEEVDVNALTNFVTRFPLKYLSVFEDAGMESQGLCMFPAASAILELVGQNASSLLEFESLSVWTEKNCGVFKDWEPPRFENLKKLSIAKNSSITKDCAKKVIRGASNLRAIHNNCLHMIPDVVPEKMYGTLKRLAFCVEDVHHIEKFVGKLDRLEELLVFFDRCWYERREKIRNLTVLRAILASNTLTLCSLDIRCLENATLFDQLELELPVLPSVKVLSISVSSFLGNLDELLRLNFRGSLPDLRKVNISEDIRFTSSYSTCRCADMSPDEDVHVASNASETTLELAIDGSVNPANLLMLRSLFPNLIKLSVWNRHYFPPLGLVGSLWPNLQCLSISIHSLREKEVGAEVFGLNSQEWKLLRQQDKEFLKRVQLAPSRPCVWTMKELKHFQLEYQNSEYLSGPETFRQFLETVAVGRMSGLSFKVKQDLTKLCWKTARFKDFGQDYRPFLQPSLMNL